MWYNILYYGVGHLCILEKGLAPGHCPGGRREEVICCLIQSHLLRLFAFDQ